MMHMAKSYYVKFVVPENLVSPIYESLRVASQTGKVRKGTNEATKAIERGISKLIVIAEDVEPPEVVAHLPIICDEREADYVFVPSKQELGKALGIDVTSAAAATHWIPRSGSMDFVWPVDFVISITFSC